MNQTTKRLEASEFMGWDVKYESSPSRKLLNLKAVLLPNDICSRTDAKISRGPKGIERFGIFCRCIQLASKMPQRGLYVDEDGPLTVSDLAAMGMVPEDQFKAAFDLFLEIGVIQAVECPRELVRSGNWSGREEEQVIQVRLSADDFEGENTKSSGRKNHASGRKSRTPGSKSTTSGANIREVKLREGERTHGGAVSRSSANDRKVPKAKPFHKPTREEWLTYLASILVPPQAAEKAFNHYETVGWTVGRNNRPMKDWKAAARTVKCNFTDEGGTLLSDGHAHKEPSGWREWFVNAYPPDEFPDHPRYETRTWADLPEFMRLEFIEKQGKGVAA